LAIHVVKDPRPSVRITLLRPLVSLAIGWNRGGLVVDLSVPLSTVRVVNVPIVIVVVVSYGGGWCAVAPFCYFKDISGVNLIGCIGAPIFEFDLKRLRVVAVPYVVN